MPMSPDRLEVQDLIMRLPGPYRAMLLADHGAGGEDRAASPG